MKEKAKLDLLCDASYAINVETRPTVLPVTTAAKLLPIRDVGHISWIPGTAIAATFVRRAMPSG